MLTENMNMNIWVIGTSNQLFEDVIKLKQNFQKNKVVVTGKSPFLWYVYFVLTILFVLTLASDIAGFFGYDTFLILVLSIKKGTPVFFKKFSFSRKAFSNLRYWKCSKFLLITP